MKDINKKLARPNALGWEATRWKEAWKRAGRNLQSRRCRQLFESNPGILQAGDIRPFVCVFERQRESTGVPEIGEGRKTAGRKCPGALGGILQQLMAL